MSNRVLLVLLALGLAAGAVWFTMQQAPADEHVAESSPTAAAESPATEAASLEASAAVPEARPPAPA
ncbi:MAG TPA: hypothetical protein VK081_06375, partial [Planctomycetota bacterium]|nr:hypothetical protein [Planctomycetota bacterium]